MVTTLRRRLRRLAFLLLFCVSLLITSGALTALNCSVENNRQVNAAYAQSLSEETVVPDVQSVVLDNGLTVLMQPMQATSEVSISIAYGAGFVDENKDEIGISHLLEHMTFRGTKKRPIEIDRLFRALGSEKSNAFVSSDGTVYHHLIADRNRINAILTLEADRMLNARIDEQMLSIEKEVVIAENEINENNSYAILEDALLQTAYPNRAYGQGFLNTDAYIASLTKTQVEAFYKKYYSPNNATLIVVGDFDAEDTLNEIKSVFGPLANTTTATPRPIGLVEAADAIPMAEQAEPLRLQRSGAPSRVQIIFPLPNFIHLDSPAIAVMHFILKQEEGYRLDAALTDNQQVGESVELIHEYRREPAWYTIHVEDKSEQPPEAIYQALQQTLSQTKQQLAQPIDSAVLSRAKERFKETVTDVTQTLDARGAFLAELQLLTGSPWAIDEFIAAVDAVTSEDVQRVAREYLDPSKAVVGFLEATPTTAQSTLLETEAEITSSFVPTELNDSFTSDALVEPVSLEEVEQYLPSITAPTTNLTLALLEKVTLENGLQVLLLPTDDEQTIAMRGWVDAGDRFDPESKAGTARLTANAIASELEETKEISFEATTDLDGVSLRAEMETENLAAELEAIAKSLQTPTFSDDLFAQEQQQLSDRIKESLMTTRDASHQALQRAMYPKGHPAYQQKTAESINKISLTDLRSFHSQHYHPNNIIITLAGKFDSALVKAQLEWVFGDWQPSDGTPVFPLPPIPVPENALFLKRETQKVLDSDVTGAYTIMGHSTISRNDPRYYALKVASEILGGGVISGRLGDSLRHQQGLIYSGVSLDLDARRDRGELKITINTQKPEKMERAVASAIAVLKQAKTEGVTAGELRLAKQSLIESYPLKISSSDSLADTILGFAVAQLDENELQTYPEKIQAVGLEDVQAAIETLIHPDKFVIVTSTPNE